MTRLHEPLGGTSTVDSAEPAAPAENPLSTDPPKLSALHDKTRDVIGKVLRKDAKTFDELARAQTSGQ